LAVSPGAGALTLGSGEIHQFAAELATQLFQRWELALQEQFRAELGLRIEAELEHREHEARQLREEVQERQQRFDNPWPTRHGAWGHATWEMENTIRRQASELAETERQMALLRQRLQELGRAPEEITVTVYEHTESQAFEGSAAQPSGEEVGDPPAGSAEAGLQGEAL
jgi:DNA repair exonuclease SbcCD ATPase subunit